MQFSAPAKVVNGDQTVLFVFIANVPHTGNFQVGEALAFSGGAAGTVTSYSSGVLSYVIPGDVKPLPGETVDGAVSLVSTTLSSLDQDPNLVNFGIEAGDFLSRVGDVVGYYVASVPQAWRLELAAEYQGASAAEADTAIHTTRTSEFDLPTFDARDRQQHVLLSELARLVDAALADHEARLIVLEP